MKALPTFEDRRPVCIYSGFAPIPWLQEKTLSALEQSVRLVDLAHEPDTTPWYRRALIEIAEPLITTLMPVVAFVHVAQEAAEHDDIRMVVEGGAFALSRWGKKWIFRTPGVLDECLLPSYAWSMRMKRSPLRLSIQHPTFEGDITQEQELKLEIHHAVVLTLLDAQIMPSVHRPLLWLLRGVRYAEQPDTVTVSKRFLPTDIGVSRAEAAEAYNKQCAGPVTITHRHTHLQGKARGRQLLTALSVLSASSGLPALL